MQPIRRIRFFRVKRPEKLSRFLMSHLYTSREHAEFLIHLGAIYVNFTRIIDDIQIQAGDILRCHTEPKRFLTDVDWSQRILLETDDFILVDKPAGMPCQMSLDNRIENLHFQLSQYTKLPLFITHRLDVGTQGLIVYGKTSSFQSRFNQSLEQHQVKKIYEAITTGPRLEATKLIHWMRPHARSPKILARSAVEGWKICELDVVDSFSDGPSHFQSLSPACSLNFYRIQLLTGRTHQIRAQLSFEQNPVLGDVLYGGTPIISPWEWYALQCSELSFLDLGQNYHWRLPPLPKPGFSVPFRQDFHTIAPVTKNKGNGS